MTDFLTKHFVKDKENRAEYGKFAGRVGIFLNVLLCAGKFAAGVISGSLSISADAVNNLSDASSSVISLIGFKLAEKKPDSEHPYGHGRYEYLAGFMVAALIIVIGAELFRDGIIKIIKPEAVDFGIVPIAVLSVSILVKLWMARFYGKIARRIESDTLRAAAADSRNDVISTAAVLVALIIGRFTGVNLDGIMGAAVAVFILIGGVGLVKDAMDPLLGKAPDEQTVEEIRGKILSYKGVLGAHDLLVHDYGPGRRFASVHVEVSAELSLVECHDIIDAIERDFLKGGLNMLVHPDPVDDEYAALRAAAHALGAAVHDIREEGGKLYLDCVISDSADEYEVNRALCRAVPEKTLVISFESGLASIPKQHAEQE